MKSGAGGGALFSDSESHPSRLTVFENVRVASVESLTRVAGPKRKYMNTLSTWDEVEEGRFVVYGSPATVRDRMKEEIPW